MRALFLAALLPVASAHAQSPGQTDDEARALFDAAQIAYAEGRYDNALDYFQRAYDLSGRARLLYNIAVTQERLQMDAQALETYERYLREEPDAPTRAPVEARIRILRRTLGRSSGGSDGSVPGIALSVAGGAVLGAGLVFLLVSALETAAVEGAAYPARWADVRSAYELAQPLGISGWVMAGLGAASLAVGLVLVLSSSGSSTRVAVGPRGATLVVGF